MIVGIYVMIYSCIFYISVDDNEYFVLINCLNIIFNVLIGSFKSWYLMFCI